jgi:hypothetical protein
MMEAASHQPGGTNGILQAHDGLYISSASQLHSGIPPRYFLLCIWSRILPLESGDSRPRSSIADRAINSLSDVLAEALGIVFNDKEVCCGKNSALEDSVQTADAKSLKDMPASCKDGIF